MLVVYPCLGEERKKTAAMTCLPRDDTKPEARDDSVSRAHHQPMPTSFRQASPLGTVGALSRTRERISDLARSEILHS